MNFYRKIALFCLFSWLVASPFPLLAQQEKSISYTAAGLGLFGLYIGMFVPHLFKNSLETMGEVATDPSEPSPTTVAVSNFAVGLVYAAFCCLSVGKSWANLQPHFGTNK